MNCLSSATRKCFKKCIVAAKTPDVKDNLEKIGVSNVELFPVGLDISIIPSIIETKTEIREKLALPSNRKIILYVGRIEEEKRTIQAVEILKSLSENYHMVMIGKGRLEEKLLEYVEKNNLWKRFQYIKEIPNTEIHYYYRACDFFVNMSVTEIFGMSIMETILKSYPNVCLIQGTGSLYYSGGMRKAIEKAKQQDLSVFDFILLVNDDVDFYEGSIKRLISYLGGEEAIMVGATENNGNLSYGGVIMTSRFRPTYKKVMSYNEKRKCDTFNANCVLIHRLIFEKLGNIDPVYEHGMGDYDYGLEARHKGVTIYVSDFFVGQCSQNTVEGTWNDKRLRRKKWN